MKINSGRIDGLERRQKIIEAGIVLVIFLMFVQTAIMLWATSGLGKVNQSVSQSVGDATPKSQRDYLTTIDVAEREQVNADTVRRWIAEGRIVPAPEQSRERGPWAIDPSYSVVHESGTEDARSVHAE